MTSWKNGYVNSWGKEKKVYAELKKIQKLLWKDDDLMEQETLFELQNYVMNLTLEYAKKENQEKDLIKSFPWLYKK